MLASMAMSAKALKLACATMKKAVDRGDLEAVQETLAGGLDVNEPLDRYRSTALLLAVLAKKKSVPVVKALLAAGAKPTKKNKYGQNALTTAEYIVEPGLVKLMRKK
jgi:ankyrin repeat protein